MLRAFIPLTLFLAAVALPASAHFPFVVADADGAPQAKVVFSETLDPDGGVDIAILKSAKLEATDNAGNRSPLTFEQGKDALRVSLLGVDPVVISGVADAGVMQRGNGDPHLLVYYPKSILGDAFSAKGTVGAKVELVPSGRPGELRFQLLADGQPVPAAEVAVLPPGAREQRVKTDDKGLTPSFAEKGRYGAWARHWEDRSGERDGKRYAQVRRYATLVIDVAATPARTAGRHGHVEPTAGGDAPDPRHRQHAFPQLPEAASSFGAVLNSDGYLYVYGGHIARTHKYDTNAVSGKFHRLKLGGGTTWEELPGGPGLQGMNLAAYGGKVYRIGGMAPRNAPGTKADTQSVAECAAYDPSSGQWEPLPSLPHPRSSHDVAVVGSQLYVVGGWWMRGKDGEQWPAEALVLDLTDPSAGWKAFEQPFRRRALIAAVSGSKVYAIGGFTEDSEPRRTVDIYDTATRTWTTGPDLPGEDRNGFAPAACTHEGRVYASVGDGSLFRLTAAGDAWEKVTTTTPRIVHRLIPWRRQILVAGGAIKGDNLALVEAVATGGEAQPAAERLPKTPAASDAAVAVPSK